MEVIDRLLSSHAVGLNETTVQDALLGVGFMVVNKTGESLSPRCL